PGGEPRKSRAEDERADDGEHGPRAAPHGTEPGGGEHDEQRDDGEVDETGPAARPAGSRDAPLATLALTAAGASLGDGVLLLAARGRRRARWRGPAQRAPARRGGRRHVLTRRIAEGRSSSRPRSRVVRSARARRCTGAPGTARTASERTSIGSRVPARCTRACGTVAP